MASSDAVNDLKPLKYARRGKKSAITKRIQQMNGLVRETTSWRHIKILTESLIDVYKELKRVCNDIFLLCNEEDEFINIEDVHMYLETRTDEPLSTGSLTESLVEKHLPGAFENCSDTTLVVTF